LASEAGLRIVVCIKQVPDTTDMRIDPVTNNLIREGVPSVVNPACLYATEEALRIRESLGGRVTAVSMGPPQAERALRDVVAMGVDNAVLVTDRLMAGADTLATSYTLWKAIQRIAAEEGPFDLLLFGRQAIDGETGQVPPGVAWRFQIPVVTYAIKLEKVDPEAGFLEARRRVDDGVELVSARMPAAVAVTEECNKPRVATVDGLLRGRHAKIQWWDGNAIGVDQNLIGLRGSPTFVKKVFVPPPRGKGQLYTMDGQNPKEAARWAVERMLERGVFREMSPETRELVSAQQPEAAQLPGSHARLPGLPQREYGDVWVYVEHRNGVQASVSWEIMSGAARVAEQYGTKLAAVVLGESIRELVSESFAYGAEKVYAVSHAALEHYRSWPYAVALAELVKKYRPGALLFGATPNGRDLAGTVATIAETGLMADCISFGIDLQLDPQGD